MASYIDLHNMKGGDTNYQPLVNKIVVAVAKKAVAIAKDAGATTGQEDWAKEALRNPRGAADQIVSYVVANAPAAAAIPDITGATDIEIQDAVDAAVDNLLSK